MTENPINQNHIPIVRYDRNLAFNVTDFEIYESDSTLIKNLIAFFSFDIQNIILNETILGSKILDPKKFAQTMGYKNYKSLLRKHDNPAQFKGMSKQKIADVKAKALENNEPLWDTELDNALYRMKFESLRLTKGGKTPDGLHMSQLHEIRFLKSLTKYYDPKRNKLFYEIEYEPTFINNLARYFLKFHSASYAQLRKPGLQDLYLFLCLQRENTRYQLTNQNKDIPYSEFINSSIAFDELVAISKTSCASPVEKKRYLTNAFKKINEVQGEELFILNWNQKGKFAYKPVITFRFSQIEMAFETNESGERLNTYYCHNLKVKFRDVFNQMHIHEDNFIHEFIKWLKDHENTKSIPIKLDTYKNTFIQCFGSEIDPYSYKYKDAAFAACNKIAILVLIQLKRHESLNIDSEVITVDQEVA